jgi:hypothetical protein
MTDKPSPAAKGPGIKIAPGSSERAQFIYFDGPATFGTSGGVIQIELAANTIMPEGAGTRTDVVITAHLRCSPGAARALKDAIDRALEMTSIELAIQPVPHSKPN